MNDAQIKSLISKSIEESQTFLLSNIRSIMTDHKEPSPVTIERFKRFEEWIKELKSDNKDRDREILNKLEEIKVNQRISMDKIEKGMEEYKEKTDSRLGVIENWKLVFTTKIAVYSSIAIVVGSAVGQLIVVLCKNIIS